MLPDLQRKLLRILFNFSSQHRRMPSWEELERKTGRRRQELSKAFEELKEKGFITWEERKVSAGKSVRYSPSANRHDYLVKVNRSGSNDKQRMHFDPEGIVMLQSRETEERAADSRFHFTGGDGEDRTKYWTQY